MRRTILARPHPPIGIALSYQRALRLAVERRQRELVTDILDRWEHRRTHGRIPVPVGHQDARKVLGIPLRVEHGDLAAIASRVAKHSSDELGRVLGVPSRSLGVTDYQIQSWQKHNADLIESLGDHEVSELETILDIAERGAWRVEDLRKAIQSQFDVTKSKADLLARDQTLKLNGQLAQHRQTQVGITQYTWSTSQDERVRGNPDGKWPEKDGQPGGHYALNGTVQSWADPPVTNDAGDTNHPGQDYQCRCVAIPILPGDDSPDEDGA